MCVSGLKVTATHLVMQAPGIVCCMCLYIPLVYICTRVAVFSPYDKQGGGRGGVCSGCTECEIVSGGLVHVLYMCMCIYNTYTCYRIYIYIYMYIRMYIYIVHVCMGGHSCSWQAVCILQINLYSARIQ